MAETLSPDARNLLCSMFWLGEKSTVTSHHPHNFLTKHRAAFDELLAAKLITQKPFNDYGSIEFQGTPECYPIWQERAKEFFARPPEGEANG